MVFMWNWKLQKLVFEFFFLLNESGKTYLLGESHSLYTVDISVKIWMNFVTGKYTHYVVCIT